MSTSVDHLSDLLPAGIRARQIKTPNGLDMHVLEAGVDAPDRPCVLLLHGFPELAFSWRKIMVPLAEAGFYVIAPDQRGYGRTTGWHADYNADIRSFGLMNLVRDCLALLAKIGRAHVDAVIGHDFGSHVAAHCALIRPDVFRSVAMMSAPFAGAPTFESAAVEPDIHEALASLAQPRKHYQWYYSTRNANTDMMNCPQGLHDFLRAYYHCKSADWSGNSPTPLKAWNAEELAKLPTYYIMDLQADMAQTANTMMPSASEIEKCTWLPDNELAFYADEYSRTGFQGGLNWYRCGTGSTQADELKLFAGRTIDVDACFISGDKDWGIYQKPGTFEAMQNSACTRFKASKLIPGAGHWVQQEQPEKVVEALLEFLR